MVLKVDVEGALLAITVILVAVAGHYRPGALKAVLEAVSEP